MIVCKGLGNRETGAAKHRPDVLLAAAKQVFVTVIACVAMTPRVSYSHP